jgi:nucleoside-specific outer membrane channel protein Tsx
MARPCAAVAVFLLFVGAPVTRAQEKPKPAAQAFSASTVQILYGWNFKEPGLSEDVPKNVFTFQNTAAWSWGSSYLFVDILRSWSEADANAKDVYGEWYPSVSFRKVSGREPSTGLVRDVSATVGLNTGVRSTGPAPFVVLPGATFDLNVPRFAFVSVGTFAYIDRGRFEGQPTGCEATTYQVTPSWALPFKVGGAAISFDGFVDFIGAHADCRAMVISQPQLTVDISALWHKPGKVYLGVEWDYWHNKYGIEGLRDNVWLPLFAWKV